MENTDFLLETMQYFLGMLPGDIATNIIAVITSVVTVCTLIIRFWKEPEITSKWHRLWSVIHTFASFKSSSIHYKEGEKKNEKGID